MTKFSRLIPLLALLAAVILLLAGIGLSIWFQRSNATQQVDEVTAQAHIVAATVTAALTFDDQNAAQEYVNALRTNPAIEAAAVYDGSGAPFAGYSRSEDAPLPATAPKIGHSAEDNRLVVVVPVAQSSGPAGTVYIRAITDSLGMEIARFGLIALLVALAALVVAILGAMQTSLTRANAELAGANRSLELQIEERERVEAALRQAQKMEVIGQLTGGVAHDFNNLLQVILGNLDSLHRRLADDKGELRRHAEAAIRGAERAATLTQRLLAFARRQPLVPKPIEINRLVSGMSDMLHRTLGAAVTIETVLAGGLWRVSVDANQLENALLNLAVNARDAMPEGGKLTIETANAYLDESYAALHGDVQPGQYVLLAVSDTGTGMTKEVLAKAFDPFYTTKETGRGSGLGLSQVYGFVKQSGGHVKIYSELGEGIAVKLYLPRLLASDAQREEPEAALPRVMAGQHELVLVVEDDEDVRENTVAMMRELGYAIVEAADGQSALRLLETEPGIRLLFTDVGLPGGINGRQLADEARQRRPGLKILFTTGYTRNAIVHQGRLDPGVELIGKPFTFPLLAAKVRRILDEPS